MTRNLKDLHLAVGFEILEGERMERLQKLVIEHGAGGGFILLIMYIPLPSFN